MKHAVRKLNPWHAVISILMGVGGTAACAAHLSNLQSGVAWNPYLAGAGGVLMVEGWISLAWLLLHRSMSGSSTQAASSSRQTIRDGLGYLRFFVLLAAVFILARSAQFYLQADPRVTDGGEVSARALSAAVFVFIMTAMRKNWLRGVLFDPQKSRDLKKRREELAEQREEMLGAARQYRTN